MKPDSAFFEHVQRVTQFMGLSQVDEVVTAQIVAEEFNQIALASFALQWERNPIYQRWCRASGVDVGSVRYWNEIPALPTTAFKEFEVTCLSPAEIRRTFHSSGTTGQQHSRHHHNDTSLFLYDSSLMSWFLWYVDRLGPADMGYIFLTPPPEQVPHSSLVHMFEVLNRKLHRSAGRWFGSLDSSGGWTVDNDALVTALEQAIKDHTPVMLFGTAFNYVHLLDDLAKQSRRLKLPFDSMALETGGYKGRSRTMPKAELHAMITSQLGVRPGRVVCEYGMCELSSQAYEVMTVNGDRVFQFPPWAQISVISPETGREVAEGEIGLLRIYDLANVWSVSAVQTQDFARRRGAGFELLGRAAASEARGCSLMSLDG